MNDQPKVQTDDHYPITRSYSFTGRIRWSELGVLQQEIQFLGTGTREWIDVPREAVKP